MGHIQRKSAWHVLFGVGLVGLLLGGTAQAAIFTVNSSSDVVDANPGNGVCETAPGNGVCTLRAAIMEANALAGADEIMLPSLVPPATYLLTVVTELTISGSLTITGGGASTTIIDGNKSARPDSGVLVITTATLNLGGVTIQNGGRTSGYGGGISNDGGTVTLTNSTVTNSASGNGGGIHNSGTVTLTNSSVTNSASDYGGGILNDHGTVTLTNSLVSGNTAKFVGGGIFNDGGTVTLTNSTVSGNSVPFGFGGGIGIVYDGGTVTLTNSTVSGNRASNHGGGIYISGGPVTLTNSTVSGNSASDGGGIHNFGTVTLTNSTVSGNNVQRDGGGIYNVKVGIVFNSTIANNQADADSSGSGIGGGVSNAPGATFTLQNTIIANNNTFFVPDDCAGTLTSQGYNLISSLPAACSFLPETGDVLFVNPGFGSGLQNNGGPTQTHALAFFSPAIDAGNPGGCRDRLGVLLPFDQRGFSRAVDGDGNGTAICDIGAFEFGAVAPPAPTGVTAVAASSTQVDVAWIASAEAISYQIDRRTAGGGFSQIGTSMTNSFSDTTASADSAALYRVRAVNGSGVSSSSAADLATTVMFVDSLLTPGTVVKAVHLSQLRTAVNAVRLLAGVPAATFTTPGTAGTTIGAVDVTELRSALDAARGALGFSTGGYTDMSLPGLAIKAVHFQELRDRVR